MKRLVIFDPEQLGSVLKTKVESYVTALVYKVGNRIFGVITAREAYNPAENQERWPIVKPRWGRDATLHFSVGYPF